MIVSPLGTNGGSTSTGNAGAGVLAGVGAAGVETGAGDAAGDVPEDAPGEAAAVAAAVEDGVALGDAVGVPVGVGVASTGGAGEGVAAAERVPRAVVVAAGVTAVAVSAGDWAHAAARAPRVATRTSSERRDGRAERREGREGSTGSDPGGEGDQEARGASRKR